MLRYLYKADRRSCEALTLRSHKGLTLCSREGLTLRSHEGLTLYNREGITPYSRESFFHASFHRRREAESTTLEVGHLRQAVSKPGLTPLEA